MSKFKNNRYLQLDEDELARFSASTPISVRPELNSFSGDDALLPFFKKSLEKLRASVEGLACGTALITAYVLWSNENLRDSKRAFESLVSQLDNGFLKYLRSERLEEISSNDIDTNFLIRFISWLNTSKSYSSKEYNPNTQRKYYGAVKAMLDCLRDCANTRHLINPALSFPQSPFEGSHGEGVPTEVLDDVTVRKLQIACLTEIKEIIDEVTKRREQLAHAQYNIDEKFKKRRSLDFPALSRAYSIIFAECVTLGRVPQIEDVRNFGDATVTTAIVRKFGLKDISLAFFPAPAHILPFILLFSIYTFANTGPLRGFKVSAAKIQEVMGLMRICLEFHKPRAHSNYPRSFAIDENAKYSPAELIKFLKLWTAEIRKGAGKYSDHLFIFGAQGGTIRPFYITDDVGTDADSSWKHAARHFFDKYGLPHINLTELRFSGADTVREIEEDDARAVGTTLGHRGTRVGDAHYDSAGAKRARYEFLSHGMSAMQRWATTRGKRDGRKDLANSDLLAATPGFNCINPYESPMPGEIAGRLCEAIGACPACPYASVNKNSAYSLARCLQLRDELKAARLYLSVQRWNAAFSASWDAMPLWLESFDDQKVIEEAAKLQLNPIGKLE